MLSNLIIIFLALIIPIGAFLSFKTGYKVGKAVAKEKEEIPPAFNIPRERDKPTQKEKKLNTILANIDAYDGTARGQVKYE